MPRGRKTKWRPDMPERAKAMMADGFSKEAVAGEFNVSEETLYKWIRERPDFAEAIKEGDKLSHKWWEDRGREACSDPLNGLFNATVWIMQMKNRFGYKDVKDTNVNLKAESEPVSETQAWVDGVFGGDEKGENPPPRTH